MKQGWKKYLLYSSAVLVVGGLVYFLIRLGYSYPETGFGEYTPTDPDTVRSKTLWDWMDLLIIPAVLAGGAILLNRSERALERKTAEDRAKLERDLATDRQQEAALQTYFDRMSELLLKEKLRTTKKAEVRDVARTRTLSIMRILDTKRNNLILQFLREAKLVNDEKSIFHGANMERMNLEKLNFFNLYLSDANLEGANLRGAVLWRVVLERANMEGANLRGADLDIAKLGGANLEGANLERANLEGADLEGANLEGATLSFANLKEAYLKYTYLEGAYLSDANLERADLEGANLEGANLERAKNLTQEQLAKVKSLKGATMPDGTKHE